MRFSGGIPWWLSPVSSSPRWGRYDARPRTDSQRTAPPINKHNSFRYERRRICPPVMRRSEMINSGYNFFKAALWIRNEFSDPDPTSQLVSAPDPDPVSNHGTWIFSNILNINFTLVFLSCMRVRLHIITRCKLFREIFVKRNLYFENAHFCWEIVKFYKFFGVSSNSFRIWSCSDQDFGMILSRSVSGFFFKFRIRPDPDP